MHSALMACRYFWRQTYDYANTKSFSELRQICRDQTPQNPDETILQCSSAKCRKWMHVKCIAEDALERATEGKEAPAKKRKSQGSNTKKKGRPRELSPTATAMATTESLIAEVFIAELPAETPAGRTEIVVTDEDGTQTSEEVKCLLCGEVVE